MDEARRHIPGKLLPPLHITVLPPRPLSIPLDEACGLIESTAAGLTSFEVEFSGVGHFTQTDFLYLDIAEGSNELHRIHDIFNTGQLSYAEHFDYRPHLTLGGPVPVGQLEITSRNMQQAWESAAVSRRILVSEMVCLWLPPHSEAKQWQRYNSWRLASNGASRPATNQR